MPAFAVALIIGVLTSGLHGLFSTLGGLGVGLAMLLPFYAIGVMGAGDVKMLGVAGAFLGPQGALTAGLITFAAGALLGLIWYAWRSLRSGLEYLSDRSRRGQGDVDESDEAVATDSKPAGIAYAPAIAIGAAFVVWQQGWLITAIAGHVQ
jgi:prepilin peptidase CpaA